MPRPLVNSSDMPLLRIAGVEKTYDGLGRQTPVPALKPVTAEIREGEFVSLVGPSGCGKTTLLKICASLVRPSGGQILYRGNSGPPPPEKFGMVFQNAALLPWRTVTANVLLSMDVLGRKRGPVRSQVDDLLRLVKLEGFAQSYPRQLSGGMQQRVAIARALIHDPEVLFMDEPFGALDAMTREQLNLELQRIHLEKEKTVVFVTHSIQEAVLLSDRVFVFSGRPGTLLADVQIALERPRTMAMTLTEEFTRLEAEVRRYLDYSHAGDLEPELT